ncbi:hypothetical protein ACLOJK_013053 [Asimina triloba]
MRNLDPHDSFLLLGIDEEPEEEKSAKHLGFHEDFAQSRSWQQEEQDSPPSHVDDESTSTIESPGSNSQLIHPLSRDLVIDCLLRLPRSNYGVLASLNRTFRSLLRSGELYKLRRQACVSEHWLYISCNSREWEAFDVSQRRWMRLPRMPPTACAKSSDNESAAAAVGTHLLVWGRGVAPRAVIKYSVLTNSWSPAAAVNTPRRLSGFASLGEIAISAGGIDEQGKILNSAELYNSEMETWVALPSFQKARYNCLAFFLDGKFYIMGGVGSNREPYTCAEEYDLEKGVWRNVGDMHPAWCAPTGPPISVVVVKNELYMADHAAKEVRKFRRENSRWVKVGRLPEKVAPSNGWGFGFRGCGERIMVVGGERGVKKGSLELYSWEPTDGVPPKWELLASRPSGKFLYSFAVMGC